MYWEQAKWFMSRCSFLHSEKSNNSDGNFFILITVPVYCHINRYKPLIYLTYNVCL